jgi:carbamoylphosphate synthase large subunit
LTTKTTERQEKIAKKIGVRLLHNTNKIRWEFENKKKFKEYLKQWKIKHIP